MTMVCKSKFDVDFARVRYRVGQGLIHLRPRRSAMTDARLRELLRPEEFDLISRLSPVDRAHHLAVYDGLVRLGCTDDDLTKAALLHDVGKADDASRVGLIHRSAAVLLNAVSPSLLHRLASPRGSTWRRALYLAEAHPQLGATLARSSGCSERTCWLIAHHHDAIPVDEPLKLLQRIDDGSGA